MKSLDCSFEGTLPPAFLRCGLAAALCLAPATLSPENVTLSTYYPAPSGVYTQVQGTQRAWLATSGGGVSIGTSQNAPAQGIIVMPPPIAGVAQTPLSNGRVGIGTLNPNDVLEVDSSGGSGGIVLGGPRPQIKLNGAIALDDTGGVLTLGGGGVVKLQNVLPAPAGPVTAMTVVGGSIGIGTAQPKAAVDVFAGAITSQSCAGVTLFAAGVNACPNGTYATWFPGVISDKQYGTVPTTDGSGQMHCCRCLAGACPSLP